MHTLVDELKKDCAEDDLCNHLKSFHKSLSDMIRLRDMVLRIPDLAVGVFLKVQDEWVQTVESDSFYAIYFGIRSARFNLNDFVFALDEKPPNGKYKLNTIEEIDEYIHASFSSDGRTYSMRVDRYEFSFRRIVTLLRWGCQMDDIQGFLEDVTSFKSFMNSKCPFNIFRNEKIYQAFKTAFSRQATLEADVDKGGEQSENFCQNVEDAKRAIRVARKAINEKLKEHDRDRANVEDFLTRLETDVAAELFAKNDALACAERLNILAQLSLRCSEVEYDIINAENNFSNKTKDETEKWRQHLKALRERIETSARETRKILGGLQANPVSTAEEGEEASGEGDVALGNMMVTQSDVYAEQKKWYDAQDVHNRLIEYREAASQAHRVPPGWFGTYDDRSNDVHVQVTTSTNWDALRVAFQRMQEASSSISRVVLHADEDPSLEKQLDHMLSGMLEQPLPLRAGPTMSTEKGPIELTLAHPVDAPPDFIVEPDNGVDADESRTAAKLEVVARQVAEAERAYREKWDEYVRQTQARDEQKLRALHFSARSDGDAVPMADENVIGSIRQQLRAQRACEQRLADLDRNLKHMLPQTLIEAYRSRDEKMKIYVGLRDLYKLELEGVGGRGKKTFFLIGETHKDVGCEEPVPDLPRTFFVHQLDAFLSDQGVSKMFVEAFPRDETLAPQADDLKLNGMRAIAHHRAPNGGENDPTFVCVDRFAFDTFPIEFSDKMPPISGDDGFVSFDDVVRPFALDDVKQVFDDIERRLREKTKVIIGNLHNLYGEANYEMLFLDTVDRVASWCEKTVLVVTDANAKSAIDRVRLSEARFVEYVTNNVHASSPRDAEANDVLTSQQQAAILSEWHNRWISDRPIHEAVFLARRMRMDWNVIRNHAISLNHGAVVAFYGGYIHAENIATGLAKLGWTHSQLGQTRKHGNCLATDQL